MSFGSIAIAVSIQQSFSAHQVVSASDSFHKWMTAVQESVRSLQVCNTETHSQQPTTGTRTQSAAVSYNQLDSAPLSLSRTRRAGTTEQSQRLSVPCVVGRPYSTVHCLCPPSILDNTVPSSSIPASITRPPRVHRCYLPCHTPLHTPTADVAFVFVLNADSCC